MFPSFSTKFSSQLELQSPPSAEDGFCYMKLLKPWDYKNGPPKPTISVDLSLVIPIYNHGFS